MSGERREAGALVGLAVMGWAFPGTFVRLMPHLPAIPLVSLRLTVAFLAVTPFLLLPSNKPLLLPAIRNWRCWVLSLGMLSYYVTATPAFNYAPIGEVALVIASAPLFAVILRLVGRQPVTRRELSGAFLAVVGVLIMSYPSITPRTGAYPLEWVGVSLSIAAAVSAAAFAIGNRHLMNTGHSAGAVTQVWLTFFLGLLLLPSLVILRPSTLLSPHMAWLLPLGVLSTALPTVAVAASSFRLPPVAVTMINPLTSVCASIVAAVVLKETPSAWTLCGGALVLAAVVTAAKPT